MELRRAKVDEVRERSGVSEQAATAALEHARGVVERAVEIARSPTTAVPPEFERVADRARAALAEDAPSLGLYELRDALPHAGTDPAVGALALVLEFHSIMSACDIETFLGNGDDGDENDVAGTLAALAAVGATNLARYLKLALDGPHHLEARARLEREFFTEEAPLLRAVLAYIDSHAETLFSNAPMA